MPKKVRVKAHTRKVKGKRIHVKGHYRTIDSKKSKGGLSFEQKMRKKGEVEIFVHNIVLSSSHDPDYSIRTRFFAYWEDGEWSCGHPEADEDFSGRKLNEVKSNIRRFFKMDQEIKRFGKITVE